MNHRAGNPAGLRERTRRAVQAEIVATAMRLFLDHGFEATTMEQIANEIGISRRSLFRYFGTKEDIVLGDHAEHGEALRTALEARPPGEPPWDALRAALKALHDALPYSPEDFLRINTMLHASPSLRARQWEKRQQWTDLLVPDIVRRLGTTTDPMNELRARALAACALACLEAATDAWVRSGGTIDMERAFDEAVAAARG
ncbi:TetR/AcrR family transcriptional regulator [Streptomyces gibsoniae]|uniref:Helix-turn-helix domain-containing protein n=1 Tax=Streptomyces gibsoniae TaxID=3075529 RepID=A0ABU2U835_9ACTN|nr:helix-turn-helix domain-containing protein [Streptomyces sp. DSM 41699]MDT0469400.1 helix-turn-helix domain-containing protein [Streptomyces sp. DSM 41699]